jgi:hypothetical protein
MTSGIEPATFRLAAHCLNQLHNCVTHRMLLLHFFNDMFVFLRSFDTERKKFCFASVQYTYYQTSMQDKGCDNIPEEAINYSSRFFLFSSFMIIISFYVTGYNKCR